MRLISVGGGRSDPSAAHHDAVHRVSHRLSLSLSNLRLRRERDERVRHVYKTHKAAMMCGAVTRQSKKEEKTRSHKRKREWT